MVENPDVVLQPATADLANLVPDLISATDPELFSHLVNGRRDVLRAWISGLWAAPDNNFSHELAMVAVRDGQLLGLELGFAGSDKKHLGRRNGELSLDLVDDTTLAHMRMTQHQGLGYFTTHVPNKSYYLMFLSVADGARNMGVGSRMLDNAFERARAAGLKSVHLDVFEGNPARRLYERAGMKALVETRVPGLESDHGIPAHHRMVLDL